MLGAISKAARGTLARNVMHGSAWQVGRVALQAITLVLLTRSMGPAGYGALAAATALFMTIAQLVGLGSGIALVRHVARGEDVASRLLWTQQAYLATSIALLTLSCLPAVWLFREDLPAATVFFIAVCELVFAPAFHPSAFMYQAQERLGVSGLMLSIAPLARLGAAISVFAFDGGLQTFTATYACALAVSLTITLAWVHRQATRTGGHRVRLRTAVASTIREGLAFAPTGVAATASLELDKTILLENVGAATTGLYASFFRIIQAATVPVSSLVLAVTPRLFRRPRDQGGDGRLVMVVAVYASIAAAAIALCAPWIALLLGTGFDRPGLLRMMSPLVVTGAIRQIVVAQLTASDRQSARNWVDVSSAVLTVVTMLATIPRFGIVAAAGTTFVADLCVSLVAWRLLRRRQAVGASSPSP